MEIPQNYHLVANWIENCIALIKIPQSYVAFAFIYKVDVLGIQCLKRWTAES